MKKRNSLALFATLSVLVAGLITGFLWQVHSPTGLAFGPQAVISTCGAITENTNLSADIVAAATCLNVTSDDVVIDCLGFNINGSGSGVGINATDRDNVTIRNCVIRGFDVSIALVNTNNSNITNTSSLDPDDESVIVNGNNNVITHNRFLTGSPAQRFDASLSLSGFFNYVAYNELAGEDGVGLLIVSNISIDDSVLVRNPLSAHNTIVGNNISVDTVGALWLLGNTTNNTFINNTAQSNEDEGLGMAGVSTSGTSVPAPHNNTFINNVFISNGTGGIVVIGFEPSGISSNVNNPSEDAAGISFQSTSAGRVHNNTFINTNVSAQGDWFKKFAADNENYFINWTFFNDTGRIRFNETVFVNGSTFNDITQSELFISVSRAFVDASSGVLPLLNRSATITLNNITNYTQVNQVLADQDNNNVFETDCTNTFCDLMSFNRPIAIFNVSHWTAFTVNGSNGTLINLTLNKTDTPDPVNVSQLLNYTIEINVSTGTVINATVFETFPAGVTFVNSSPDANASNNTWILGNLTGPVLRTINITVNVSNGLANGTVLTNNVNLSFSNSTGGNLSVTTTETTTVIAPVAAGGGQAPSVPGSGGGGGSKYYDFPTQEQEEQTTELTQWSYVTPPVKDMPQVIREPAPAVDAEPIEAELPLAITPEQEPTIAPVVVVEDPVQVQTQSISWLFYSIALFALLALAIAYYVRHHRHPSNDDIAHELGKVKQKLRRKN